MSPYNFIIGHHKIYTYDVKTNVLNGTTTKKLREIYIYVYVYGYLHMFILKMTYSWPETNL